VWGEADIGVEVVECQVGENDLDVMFHPKWPILSVCTPYQLAIESVNCGV
jgi:hypothetical protein